jgi:hypothetical protein
MKGLSLTQPWATLVAIGAKKFETRSWYTAYRGKIAIHASKSYPRWARKCEEEEPFHSALRPNGAYANPMLCLGKIIAIANLVDVVPTSAFTALAPLPQYAISDQERAFGDYSENRYAFQLENVRRVDPIGCTGALGLWVIPDGFLLQIREEIEA